MTKPNRDNKGRFASSANPTKDALRKRAARARKKQGNAADALLQVKDFRTKLQELLQKEADKIRQPSANVPPVTPAASLPTPAVKTQVTHYAIVFDRSGSMDRNWERAVAAFNDTVKTLQVAAVQPNQRVTVTPVLFSTHVQFLNKAAPIGALHPLQESNRPSGDTALLDAVGAAILQLQQIPTNPDEDTAYFVLVVTDGEENRSVSFNAARLSKLIQDVQATNVWTIGFLVPPGAAHRLSSYFNIPRGNISEWEATDVGTQEMGMRMSASVMSYSSQRQAGATRSTSVFTTDLSGVSHADAVRQLQAQPGARIWTVGAEVDIKSFIEAQGLPYVVGKAYYQLTKRETIQFHKNMLLVERGKRTVFGGQTAVRQMLKLPLQGDARVVPGNHGNWEIFVQSTSTNRKLVRGTRVIYLA